MTCTTIKIIALSNTRQVLRITLFARLFSARKSKINKFHQWLVGIWTKIYLFFFILNEWVFRSNLFTRRQFHHLIFEFFFNRNNFDVVAKKKTALLSKMSFCVQVYVAHVNSKHCKSRNNDRRSVLKTMHLSPTMKANELLVSVSIASLGSISLIHNCQFDEIK